MLVNRLFGLTCQSCQQPFTTGSVWLESDAAEKDLRFVVASVVGVQHSGICPKCKTANQVKVEALEFIEVRSEVLESIAA